VVNPDLQRLLDEDAERPDPTPEQLRHTLENAKVLFDDTP
jgi:hypothetical protein